MKKTGVVTEQERQALMKYGHHVEHTPEDVPRSAGQQFTKTVKTTIYIPEEKMVKVPVVRKEKERIVEKHVVQGSKLVPVTKYKEVQEIGLHDRPPIPGERARNGGANTQVIKTYNKAARTRKIPYTDFEEQTYDIVVDVPREVIKTRVGYRMDKQLRSQAVDVEEDNVYEMRPVLIKKGEARAKELHGKEYHGKAIHGEPVWEGGLHDGWRPEFGAFTPSNSRPGSASSSRMGTARGGMMRPGTGYSGMGSPTGGGFGSPSGGAFGGSPSGGGLTRIAESTSRPATGTRSAPNLHARH